MTQTFNENVVVDGVADLSQLTVQGHSTQTNPLQVWEDSAGSDLARLTGDGRWQQGNMSMASGESLLEAHQEGTSASTVQRGFNSKGRFTGAISDAISWLMSELELAGVGTITGIHRAIRAKLSHDNATGDSTNADLRAGDFEAANQSGTSGSPVGQMTAVQGTVDNQADAYLSNARAVAAQLNNATGATITQAAAFEVLAPANTGTIETLVGLEIADIDEGEDNFAIRTGAGKVELGDLASGLVKSTDGLLANAEPGTDHDIPMVGANGTVAGEAGVVPQPAATDNTKFLRGDASWAIPALNDLTDVDTSGASADEVLTFNGTNWVPQAVAASLDDLTDVDTSGAAADEVLTFNGTNWVPQAVVIPPSFPAGAGMSFYGSSAPSGWLLCDGAPISRSTYAALFAVIGTSYGAGDGSTTFNLPDRRGRVGLGAGQGSGLTNRSLGSSFGEENHQLTTSEMPSHNHNVTGYISGAGGTSGLSRRTDGVSSNNFTSGNRGGDDAHNNMQPSLVVNYIIKI